MTTRGYRTGAGVRFLVYGISAAFLFGLQAATPESGVADEETVPAGTNAVAQEEILRSYLLLQGQLHDLQQQLHLDRQQAAAVSQENTTMMAERLREIEASLQAERKGELEAMRESNRTVLIVAAGFAGLGFLTMVVMALLQWRAINRLAGIPAAFPSTHLLGAGPAIAALTQGDTRFLLRPTPAEQADERLAAAFARLEQRIAEMERGGRLRPADGTGSLAGNDVSPVPEASLTPNPEGTARTRLSMLLGKGQSLLNMDKPEEALACFEEALALHPDEPEALVKKGMALERLGQLEAAIQSYDRAIARDDTLTVAYLYKGGLFNRLERFKEALECYEQALRIQEKTTA